MRARDAGENSGLSASCKPFARRLEFHLPQLFLNCCFALAILFFGYALLTHALLLRPELFLDQAILGCSTAVF